ncbi:unnamed protein product [Cunninghamella blakesleeana]
MSQNRYSVLLGDDDQELDKLGNTKESENKQIPPPRRTHKPAMSPPSRKSRGKESETFEELHKSQHKPNDGTRGSRDVNRHGAVEKVRGRPFDRHSAAAYDGQGTKKKNDQSWGNLVSSEIEGAEDTLSPNDPASKESTTQNPSAEETDQTITFEAYKAQQASLKKDASLNLRRPNEGLDDDSWKNNIIHKSDNDDYFSGKGATSKTRVRIKKEKVFLEIDPPKHQSNSRGRGGKRRGNGRSYKTRSNEQINLADNTVFPTLG